MPNTILKRWNGSAFEELYPKTSHTQIIASGTADLTTVLRGNGTWGLANGHSHGNINLNGQINSTTITPADQDRILVADASNSGTIERGIIIGTGTTTFLRNDGTWATPPASSYTLPLATTTTLGGIQVGFTSTETNRAVTLSGNNAIVALPRQIPAVTLNNASNTAPSFYAPTTGGTAWQVLISNGSTSTPSWGNTTSVVNSSAINSATDYTTIVSGTSSVIVAIYRDATTKVAEYIVNIKNADEYSTTTRNFRYVWNDGTSTFANLLQVQATGTGNNTLRLRHGSGGTMIFRVTKVV